LSKRIIKGSGLEEASPVRRKVVEREIFDAHDQSRRILDAAEKEAAKKIEEARAEAEAIQASAREDGYREGLGEWQSQIAHVVATRQRIVEEAEPQIVDIALRVAEKILRRQLEVDADSVVPIVEVAVKTLRDSPINHLEVIVNPDDFGAVEAVCERLKARDPRWQTLVLTADEGMARGGCRVHSEFGEIDASVETQLEAIRKILLPREVSE